MAVASAGGGDGGSGFGSDNRKKITGQCWKRGTEALSKEQFDYAVQMFRQCVDLEPDNLMFRQTLRGASMKKYGDNGKGAGGFAKAKLLSIRGRCKKARAQSRWEELDKAAQDGLQLNPWDGHFLSDVGESAYQRGFLEVAEFAYNKAKECEPKNVEFWRALATILEERGNYVEAGKCWDRVYKLDPSDGEARKKATDMLAGDVLTRSYDSAESTQDVQTSAYDADRGQRARAREAVPDEMSDEERLQRVIRKDPADTDNYLRLADLYKREQKWDQAVETLQQALQASGGDPNVREVLEDAELKLLEHNRDKAREAAQDSGDEADQELAGQLAKEFVQREIEVLSSRVERYPKDSKLKYELGRRLMQTSKYREAIPLFQQCAADNRYRGQVLFAMGKCFIAVKNDTIAERQFQEAAKHVDAHDDPGHFCDVYYHLARLAEKGDRKDDAIGYYNEILAVDFDYKDALKRMEKLQGGGS